MSFNLQFLGATGTVTGSKYLLEHDGKRILVDCGLFQGFKQLRLRNWAPMPVKPATLDAVILTHAHLDHSGYVPVLVKNGYQGKIYCTEGTRDLCNILLPDSGRLQEEEADYANRRGFSKHSPARALYTEEDAKAALRQLYPIRFGHTVDIGSLHATLHPAGHLLGAATLSLIDAGRSVVFTGDLGRPHDAVMHAPAVVREADYLIVESTYGNRVHDPEDPRIKLGDVIRRTTERGGVVLIPSFAVGRAQELLLYLHRMKEDGDIPKSIPVYLNSPMAVDATHIYNAHHREHRLTHMECKEMCNAATFINSPDESRALNEKKGPMIIIAASGMATGGRVVHHIKAFGSDPRNTILFSGFQAGGTRGAAMLAGAESVKIHGEYVPILAEIAAMTNLSAHADSNEIMGWLQGFHRPPLRTFVTHGEPIAADALRHRIEEELKWTCEVPEYMESFELK